LTKIFKYELKRLVINKFFFALLAISLIYSYIVLSGDIIIGIAYTAPFSSWSYGLYLGSLLPLLLIALLFFITFLFSNQENRVKQITLATQVNPRKYCLIKCSAIAIGYFIISLSIIALSFMFYGLVFRFYGFSDFIVPIIVTLIPALLFIFGVGLIAGSVHPSILYALMVAVILLGLLPLPLFFDIYGARVFGEYPLTLPVGPRGEPEFVMPLSFIMGRVMFSLTGVFMMLFGAGSYYKPNSQMTL